MVARGSRSAAVLALLAAALLSGALVGLVAATFFWLVATGTNLLWTDLPERLGVEPFAWWWVLALPVAGGVVVGLCQRVVGDYPQPIEEAVGRWRSGDQVPAEVAPRTGVNAVVVLVLGGPVGFEAALVGLLGGTATFVGARMRSVGTLVRQVWGAERIDALPHRLRQTPYWLAALVSLLVFRALPFGALDGAFRFGRFDGSWGLADVAAVLATALVVTVPVVVALLVVGRAERSTRHRRAPVRFAVVGALAFALLALVDEGVLFSGQLDLQQLPGRDTTDLVYLAGAKWLALVIALIAGWRGGPIFPMYTSVGALAVLAAEPLGVAPDLLMVGAVAAVSTVVAKGNLVLGWVLSLYVVPVSYGLVTVVGCTGAVVALALLRSTGLGPATPTTGSGPPDRSDPAGGTGPGRSEDG